MLDWCDLLETVSRQRTTGTQQTRRGKMLATATAIQSLRALIQPHRGNLKYEVEGAVQDVTEVMYCNFTTQKVGGSSTDIRELDTIVRSNGQQRRVAFVADEGGQGDHFKVYLTAFNSGTGATGD